MLCTNFPLVHRDPNLPRGLSCCGLRISDVAGLVFDPNPNVRIINFPRDTIGFIKYIYIYIIRKQNNIFFSYWTSQLMCIYAKDKCKMIGKQCNTHHLCRALQNISNRALLEGVREGLESHPIVCGLVDTLFDIRKNHQDVGGRIYQVSI